MRIRQTLIAAAVPAAAFLFVLVVLPEKRRDLGPAAWQPDRPAVAGAIHVHTLRSDGSGSPDEVAAAAARAGLQFIVFTDHGDGTRPPDAPVFRSGVLCIDAVEISTTQGHYIALGIPQAPYPLGGEPVDVIEDVARLGGFGIAAHPDSTRPRLQWHEWSAPLDGLEWLNADSEWRNESSARLARALTTYAFRPVETLGSLLDRPDSTLRRWDQLAQQHQVIGLAGSDAHARLGWQDDDAQGYRREWFLRLPSYDVSFRAFAVRAVLARQFSGDAAADAAQLLDALRKGHAFTAIDAIASPVAFEFYAASEEATVEQGDRLRPGKPVTLRARVNAPSGGTITLRRNGALIAERPVPNLTFDGGPGAGVYRVEVSLAAAPGHPPVPWIVSNPIYVQPDGWGTPPDLHLPPVINSWGIQGGPWHVETGAGSTGTLTTHAPPTGPVELAYRLAIGPRAGQYAALVMAAGNALTGHTRLAFHARASNPMRVSVQARRPSGERWHRSIYLDATARDLVIPFDAMTPITPTTRAHFDPPEIDTLLFVVDTTNSAPGGHGQFEVGELRVEH